MHRLLLIFCGLLLSSQVLAQSYTSEDGYVAFHSKVPLHDFTGEANTLIGSIDFSEGVVDFYVDLETLKTGNRKRDRDMRRTLNTEEHPFASFYGTLGNLEQLASAGTGDVLDVLVTGAFSVNGISRDIEVPGTITLQDGSISVEAAWEILLDDYEVVPPRLLFMKVDEVQRLEIKTTLLLQDPESD